MNKKILFIWTLIIILLILSQELIAINSTKIILNTKPIDPRDLIRGSYVNLKFDINTIKDNNNEIKKSKTVYIILSKDENDNAKFKSYSFKKPKDELFLKANVNYCYNSTCYLEYGFEDYFINSKSAKNLEKKENLKASILVNKFGFARLLDVKF